MDSRSWSRSLSQVLCFWSRSWDFGLLYIAVGSLQIKVKGACSSLWEPIWQLWGITCHMGSHSVTLPVTWHKWMRPVLTPASQAGTRFTYSGGMEGWVDLCSLIAARPGIKLRALDHKSDTLTIMPSSHPTVQHLDTDAVILLFLFVLFFKRHGTSQSVIERLSSSNYNKSVPNDDRVCLHAFSVFLHSFL